MHIVFALVRFFPFWGLMAALIFFEFGRSFRHKDSKLQYSFFFGSVLFFALVVCWFYFRGDVHSDTWVRFFFKV